MPLRTDWLTPPPSIGGLDHLGTQAPCILAYSQLLPGITNVTDRARYYSFYPWVIWSLEKYVTGMTRQEFVEKFRRADCLFTLIAERHARISDQDAERHGAAMVGRMKLTSALTALEGGTPLRLNRYTAQDSDTRYFQNEMGGLGQYYAGILTDFAILDSRSSNWIGYSRERGQPIAESLDKTVDGKLFWQTCDSDKVTLAVLDRLAGFCPCHLPKSTREHRHLQALFFNETPYAEEEGVSRRNSLSMLLHLAHALQSSCPDEDLTQLTFRGCIYTSRLPSAAPWELSTNLESTRALWALYERGDLLSVAFQCIFAAALTVMNEAEHRFLTAESFAGYCLGTQTLRRALGAFKAATLESEIEQYRQNGPALVSWRDADHEVQLAERAVSTPLTEYSRSEDMVGTAIRCLVAIAAREMSDPWDYTRVGWTEETLSDYPINLVSFRRRIREWLPRPMSEVTREIVQWTLSTHLRVALRKLRHTGQSSFRFRPTEMGFEVIQVPPPANTIPRFRQATQMLRDLAMLRRVDGVTRLTALGQQKLESVCA